MKINFKQGVLGRWRWFMRSNDDKYLGGGPVRGFGTKDEAIRNAKKVLSESVTMPDQDGWEMYANEREFDSL